MRPKRNAVTSLKAIARTCAMLAAVACSVGCITPPRVEPNPASALGIDVIVTHTYKGYTGNSLTSWIVQGNATNNTGRQLASCVIQFVSYDEAGTRLEERSAFANNLPAGERFEFNVQFFSPFRVKLIKIAHVNVY